MNYVKDLFYITALVLVTIAGCRSPLGKFNNTQEQVDTIETKVQQNENQQVESGRTFVYAADQALQKDPQPSPHSQVAKSMTSRSLTALGQPQAENALKSNQMIDKLLSDNPEVIEEGQAELMTMDKQLIAYQNKNRSLHNQLFSAEQELKRVNQINALNATKYDSLMSKFYWLIGVSVFFLLVVLFLKVFSIIAPFAIPASGASSTLLKVVQGIQKVRDHHMVDKPDVLRQIDDHLRTHLDKKDRWLIAQAKEKLHMI